MSGYQCPQWLASVAVSCLGEMTALGLWRLQLGNLARRKINAESEMPQKLAGCQLLSANGLNDSYVSGVLYPQSLAISRLAMCKPA